MQLIEKEHEDRLRQEERSRRREEALKKREEAASEREEALPMENAELRRQLTEVDRKLDHVYAKEKRGRKIDRNHDKEKTNGRNSCTKFGQQRGNGNGPATKH